MEPSSHPVIGLQMFAWSQVLPVGWLLLLVFVVLAVGPLVFAWRRGDPLSLAMVLSLLLCWGMQTILSHFEGTWYFLVEVFALNPAWQEDPQNFHRLLTSGWLHATTPGGGISWQHIVGNVIVIALVGVPLEQRLGRERWLIIYLAGVLGGNLAWWFSHWGGYGFSLGASGAAFGLLGCYLACWPHDEIEFPLILIRKWPVALIALLRLGIEIISVWMKYGGIGDSSNVAHLAHVGGFFLCYAIGRPLARSGPTPLELKDGGPTAASAEASRIDSLKQKMGDMSDDPWSAAGVELSKRAARALASLRQEGDELETRQAWLEELAEVTVCPECQGGLKVEMKGELARLECTTEKRHLNWP
jgi:membrane associated rhomboid family serine protease